MKKLVGTFRTEEEAILAINDLKDMGLAPDQIAVMTNEPMVFKKIERSFGQGTLGMVEVGDIAYGSGVHSFMTNLSHYGFTADKASHYHEHLRSGNILVFIGLHDELHHHIENPGTYQAKELHIDDIETPGTYTLVPRSQKNPDTPGKYLAEEYGDNPENPGTYQDPNPDEEILTPGSITDEDELMPHHNMIKNTKPQDDFEKK